jgi:two-component system, NtrC family, response regulator HydG
MGDPRDGHHDEPSTVVKEGTPPVGDQVLAFVVDVVDGPDKGTRFAFDSTRPSGVLVGQSSACDVRLTDRHVSRRHVELDVTEKGLRVTDLDSTNGTFVTGVRIAEAYLAGGEVVRLGQTALRIVRALSSAKADTPAAHAFGGLIGESPEMRRLYPLCERLAKSDVPVVIEGDTGTGKEVLAEALHQVSARASSQFVVFDCTAVPPSLLESALFGHERGAFTGALSQRRGVFEQAHGGTLFLDEIGDLELALQPKLLRAIERGEVQRVGASQWLRVDVRIIAATRRDLDREVQAGRFRDDLFFRLAVGRIELPPLRRRRGDVAVLAAHFWHAIAGPDRPIPAGLVERLEDYPWPGNVRELQNAIARHVAMGELPAIGASTSGPGEMDEGDVVERVLAKGLPLPLARAEVTGEFERRYVERVLEQHGGNVSKAAAASGIALRYFQLIKARRTK